MTQSSDSAALSSGHGGEGPPRRQPRSRWWWALAAPLVIGFVALLIVTTEQAAVPVGGSGAMSGMSMRDSSGDRIELTIRDVDGRALAIPDGRPGVAVFVQATGCPRCVQAVRAAAQALHDARGGGMLLVISVDASTSRSDLAQFASSAGEPAARYAVDDRTSTLANAFGATTLGEAVVYGPRGRVVERTGTPIVSELARALARGVA